MSEQTGPLTNWRDSAKARIRRTVKTLYFPEIWYAIENYFQAARTRSVLDVGSGNGLIAEAFGKSGWEVTAVDPSLTCLRLAQKRFAMSGLEARFEQCDPDKLPFADASYEYITSVNMLEFSEDAEKVVKEIERVLRPGGRAVIASFNRRSPWGFVAVARMVRRDYGSRYPRFLSKDELVTMIRQAGLTLEAVTLKARYLPTATRLSKIRLPISGCFVALVYKKRSAEDAEETALRASKNFILE